jgi:putative addiction module component (TIGR02574 family)
MTAAVRLSEMTLPEKLQLMEALWTDLSRQGDAFESPEWHREVLEERERQIAAGEAHFIPWEQAKAEIRKECLGN